MNILCYNLVDILLVYLETPLSEILPTRAWQTPIKKVVRRLAIGKKESMGDW